MDYPNLLWLQWGKATFLRVLCYRLFWMVYFIVFAKKLSDYDNIQNYDDVSNLAKKLTVTAGIFLIDTQMSVMIKVTA